MTPYDLRTEKPKRGNMLGKGRSRALLCCMLFSLCSGLSQENLQAQVNTQYSISWMGNSFRADYVPPANGLDDYNRYVQQEIADIYVTPDGTVLANNYWDEAGRNLGVYKDGNALVPFSDAYGGHITANGTYMWASTDEDSQGNGDVAVRRFFFANRTPAAWSGAPEAKRTIAGRVSGLAANATQLFVSANGTIRVYNASTMASVRSFAVPSSRKLALDSSGSLWVVVGNNVIRRYSTTGARQSQTITLPADSYIGDIASDGFNRLYVADNGPRRNVRVYTNINGTPSLQRTIGATGGIYNGVHGRVGPLRFHHLVGVGADNSGSVYVGMGGLVGTVLEKYSSANALVWRNYALTFEDNVVLDPEDDTQAYSMKNHYVMDWNKPAGQEATWVGFHPAENPDDNAPPAVDEYGWTGFAPIAIRHLDGYRFMFVQHQAGANFTCYRLDDDGETTERGFTLDGAATVDSEGNIWGGDGWDESRQQAMLQKWTYLGLDEELMPVYSEPENFPAPDFLRGMYPFGQIMYVAETDTMYIAGWTASNPPPTYDAISTGRTLVRFNNWSTLRTVAWERNVAVAGNDCRSFEVAGNYIFTSNFGQYGRVKVWEAATGRYLFDMATPNSYTVGAMWSGDADHGLNIRAFKRSNGEYVIFYIDHVYAKTVIFRWRP